MENLVYHAIRMVKESNMCEDAKMEVIDLLNLDDILKVQEYKKLEESGLLVKLPCKVGGIIYHYEKGMKEPIPHQITEMHIREGCCDRIKIKLMAFTGCTGCDFMGNLDEGWYLTKREADEKFSELN